MIVTTKEFLSRYSDLHPRFAKAFECVSTMDFLKLDLGRIEIDGNNLYINNSAATGVSADSQVLEMHRDYIDIHVLLQGHEKIGYKPISKINNITKPYDKEGDFELSDDKPDFYVDMVPGDICIVYPEDAHAPLIGNGDIRKAVVKILL